MREMQNIVLYAVTTLILGFVLYNYTDTAQQLVAVLITALGAYGTIFINSRSGHMSELPLLATIPILFCGLVFMLFSFSF